MTVEPPLLELRDFGCERDERVLFAGLNLKLLAGETLQVLGANGVGKTTLLRALARINTDFCGEILFRGFPLAEVSWDYANDCLYLGHMPGIKKSLSPYENLCWYAAQTEVAGQLQVALDKVGLSGYQDTPCFQLSAGQLRRVALARLHLSRASLWILDEPFTAIDKRGVQALEALIASHCRAGGAVVMTSHQDLQIPGLRQLDLQQYRPTGTGPVPVGDWQ